MITIDSSPKPHTSTFNCGGNCVKHKHSSPIPFPQSPFKSPPTKVSKLTIGVYTPEHQVESIVSNFGKLKSPGKSAHVAASSLSNVDRHTCTKTSTSYVNNLLSDQHVKSKPLPALTKNSLQIAIPAPRNLTVEAKLLLCSEYIHHLQISIHIIPFIPATNSLATGSTFSVRSNNLSIDFLLNARDPTLVGNGSDLYGQFNSFLHLLITMTSCHITETLNAQHPSHVATVGNIFWYDCSKHSPAVGPNV